jgi:allantoate deiminase
MADMTAAIDAVGNVRGRYEGSGPDARAVLLGSHLDTVYDAGRWDGVLGILVAIAIVERLRAAGRRPPFAIELAAFADEEGVRYGTAYLGSRALTGTFDASWLERRDADGITMADALRAAGREPAAIASARRDPASLLGYAEVHIEQGPVLEAAGAALGIVDGIAGQTRAHVALTGRAGHAGTVPLELRRDALCAGAELALTVEALARNTAGLVATVGELTVDPGVANVIPGRVELSIDVRHAEDATRGAAVSELRSRAGTLASARGVELAWEPLLDQPAVRCDARLASLLERAVIQCGLPAHRLASGAGHDAAVLAPLVPSANVVRAVRRRGEPSSS